MKWIKYKTDPELLRNLPQGTILKVESDYDPAYTEIKVLGNG